ncbi:sulfurtransferase [Kouleothrix aurantiaca]|uniref:Sulfurtransferase n=1 Tax=Kouleothrix aurantiaca TaxID=186479 RepID=A0A0P9FCP2_9CHLR|nr:sulfurtransferase [Kouleothrix aurantiaca]
MSVEPLVTPEWLNERLGDPSVLPVDVRWYLTEPGRGRSDYDAGHIAGAPFMDLDADLAAPRGQGPGRHPLPTPEQFAAAASRAGIGPDTHVVAYDSSGGAYAARLWWLLRYFGHEQVSLLDGGWPAWQAAGFPTETAAPAIAPAEFVAVPHPGRVVDAEQVDRLRRDPRALVRDARATERYEGQVEPIDPQAGHIPGARSAPFAGNLSADGTFKSADELRDRYLALGADAADPIVCYCGSGVTAAHDVFALHLAGRTDALLYEGSWSDWSSDPSRPVATGPGEP